MWILKRKGRPPSLTPVLMLQRESLAARTVALSL